MHGVVRVNVPGGTNAQLLDTPISTDEFRALNGCLDDAIAIAVTEYGRARNQFTLDGETARGNERLRFLAHELRNLTNTAIIAFEVLKTGNVGLATVPLGRVTSSAVSADRTSQID